MKIVSFEVAKEIKAAGYPQGDTDYIYICSAKDIFREGELVNKTGGRFIGDFTFFNTADAPTYLEVWLWLWREKKIRIEFGDMVYKIYDATEWIDNFGYHLIDLSNNIMTDPEEAIIAAIEYLVDKLRKTKETKFKYETIMEDWHGHCRHDRFEAASDEEAKRIVNEKGFNYFGSHDCLWRVCGDYVDHSHFTEEEEEKMKRNYIEIKF